jgi:protocatechuate 3,4-dioxygenase beta subunit
VESGPESNEHDECAILHDEIDRLPKRQRTPIVLCYLQAMTYDQAARALRSIEPTVRSRLAKARKHLKARLIQRGVSGAVLGALVAGRARAAAVPSSCASRAVDAAARGMSAATAAGLAGSRGWVASFARSKGTAVAVALAGAASIAVALARPDGPPKKNPAEDSGGAGASRRLAPPAVEPPAKTLDLRGRVVDPDGKPVRGASVRLADFSAFREFHGTSEPMATTDASGTFTLAMPRVILERSARNETGMMPPRLVASAPGFGPGVVELGDQLSETHDVTLRLARDDVPIEGRIVDLQGKPIAGVKVEISGLYGNRRGDLNQWLNAIRTDPRAFVEVEDSSESVPYRDMRTTGADGRFRFEGLGRDRMVTFRISSPTIVLADAIAMTKDFPPIRIFEKDLIGPEPIIIYGHRFDFVAAPCRPVVGVVRDRDTGQPLVGVHVGGAAVLDREVGYGGSLEPQNRSVTDRDGRYHLTGMPTAAKYRLLVSPGDGQPYPAAAFVESASGVGLAPATIDLRIKRGLLIRGRITDKVTGAPIIAGVEALAHSDNPHVDEYPGFRDSIPPRAASTADGRFAIAVIPGPGILAVADNSYRYRRGVGSDQIPLSEPDKSLPTLPSRESPHRFNLVVPFDAKTSTTPLDLQLDPGRSRSVKVVDADGKPVSGCFVYAQTPFESWSRHALDLANFEVIALDASKTRHVLVFHEGRKLGGDAVIDGQRTDPVIIVVRRCAVVSGRIVDGEGRPRTDIDLINYGFFPARPNEGVFRGDCAVDRNGRFRIELVPGVSYSAMAENMEVGGIGPVFERLKLAPGELKDLGDIRLK